MSITEALTEAADTDKEKISEEQEIVATPPPLEDYDELLKDREELQKHREWQAKVNARRVEVRRTLLEMNDAKDHLKECKQRYELSIADLTDICTRNPLQENAKAAGSEEGEEIDASFEVISDDDSNEDWRTLDMENLSGVTEKQCEKLAAAGIDTLGDLQDAMKKDGMHWAEEISGIGEKARTKIEDAFNELMLQHSSSQPGIEPVGEPAEEAKDPDPEVEVKEDLQDGTIAIDTSGNGNDGVISPAGDDPFADDNDYDDV